MSSSSFEKWASKYSDAHKEKYASRTKEDVQKGAKQYEKERDERLAKEYIKPDTIEKDIEELGAIVNNAYNDWQDPDTMASTKDRVTRMKNRLSVYETWKKKYGKNSKYDISGILSAYKGVLDDWDGLSKIYSRYDNKEQYQSAKKIEETAKKYIDVIGRDHTFTEEEELKKSIDDIILDYKAKYPENYAKNRDFFDETIKYAIDNDYRSGVQGTQALAKNIEAYKSSVKNGDTKSAEAAKQAAWADVQNIKKNAPKYYAENASGIFNLYSGVLSSDEISNISKEFSDSVRDSIWTPEMQNEYNKNAQEMDSIKNAVGEWVYDSRIRGFRNTVTGETKAPDQYNALSDEEKKPLESNARYNELEKRNAQLGLIRSNAVDKQAYVDYTISREWELSKFKDKYGDEWYYGNGKHPNTKQASEIILDIFSQKEEENAQTSAVSAGLSPIPTTAPVFESAFKSANEDLYDKAKKGLATEADLREVINKIYGEGFVTDEDINRLGVMYSKKSGDGRASSNPWSDYSKSFLDPRYNVMTEEATRAEYERIANEGSFAQKSGARLIGLGTSFISAIPAAAESMVSAVDSNIKKAELPNYKTHQGYGLFSSLKSGTDEGRAAIATNQNADVLEFLGMNKEDAKNWGSGIYSVTNGIAENLMRAPLGPTMAGIMMFSQSFSSEYKSGVDSYKDPTKNAVSSITSAVSEGLTEKIELGAFGKALSKTRFEPNLFKRAIKAGALSGGNEILGELSNDAVRYISDYALNGEESDLAREARKLVVNGKANSIDNAVFKILAKNGLNTAVVSFISGDVLGGIGGLTNYVDASDIRRDGEKLINSGADINEIIKLGMSSSNKETRELAANLDNAISKDGKIDGLDVQLLFSSVINDAADNKINVGEVDDFVKNLSKSEETPDTIESAAELALENAIADVSKTNSTESGKLEATKADTAKRTIPLDDKKPKVTVATKDGGSVTVNGREFVTINGRGVYIVDGSQLGASQKYYAVDASTGKAIAASDTNKKLTNAVYDFKAEMEKADSYIKDDIDSFEEYIDVASDIAVDKVEAGVKVADSNGDVAVAEIDSPVEVDETAKKSGDDGKKTTVTLISKDGLKTYEGVSVAEDTGYELTAVERNGGITIVEKRSGMEFAHGATVEEAIAKVRNTIEKNGNDAVDAAIEKAIERRKASVNTSAGSTSPIEGDRLSVGRAVADADYTNTLLEIAKTSKNENARKAAALYSSYDFKNDNERYRALGDIAKMLGVSEADLVKSRAKSLFAKIRASISSETDVVDKTNAKIYEERQAAVSRGDTATVKALDYLTNLLNSEGSIISVSEMFAPNQYSAENPNVAVQVYGKRMETAFKNIGLDISVSVYYDSSENAARGEWIKHPDGHSEIKLNGAKLQGEQSAFWVVSHELIHEAESKSPGITQRMLDAFTKMGMYDGSQYEAYKARYSKKCEADFKKALDRGDVTQDGHDEFVRNYVNEEIVADLMSETMSSSELVEVFAGKLGEDDANVIVSFLKWIKNGIKSVFNSKDEFPNKFSDIIGMFEGAVKGTDTVGAKVNEATENVGVQFDSESKSAAPQNKFSYTTWSNSEYVQNRDVAASALAKAVGVSKADAERYINNINSIAKYIADNKERLDYEPNLDEAASVLKSNQDYKWTVDMSTLCAKRLITTGTFDAIQKALPNTVFDSEDIVHLRDMLMQRGYEVACGICYVESTRRELGPITADFIERYKESQQTGKPIQRINSEGKRADLKKTKDQMATTKDKSTEYFYADKDYTPTLADLNTTDIDRVKVEHPLVYEAYLNFMNARGQAKPKLLETRAEYKGEILNHFKQKNTVNSRNNAGGLRLQSFSDFEIAHLIDMMQITLDMSKVGLMSQAYTKVPAFAEVFGGTGIKINLSLIAKDSGLDANGNLIFDDVEGINHEEAFRLRDKYSENVGTILVGKNDAHIKAAMADPRIDFIIPFHKSSWKESLYDSLGLKGYEDYTDTQHEKPLDKSRKIHDFQPSEYWDYSKSGDENADIYLKKCREDGRIPKFPRFAGKPGYWKLLIDFKMYDNNGVGSPQTVVKPEFDMDSAMDIMEEYKGGHQKLPVAQDVVDDFVAEYKGEKDVETRFALSGKKVDKEGDSGYNNVINDTEVTDNERELLDRVRKSGELGREHDSDTSYRRGKMGEMGSAQSQKPNTPHTRGIHRSGVSAKGLTDSGLTAEQHNIRQQNKQEGFETEFFTEAVFNGENKQGVFNTDNTVYYPAYDFEQSLNDKDHIRYNATALLKESTIDTYLRNYAAKSIPNYAQAYIAYMSPSDFLELTTSGAGSRIAIERESTKLQENKFGEATRHQPIQLMIDHKTGKVESHEGRHRMVALMNEGIYHVPVLLFDSSNKYDKNTLTDFELVGQFNESHTATVGEAIPLNYTNRDLVIEKFGTMSPRQKAGERYGTSKTLRYSLDDTGVYSLEDAWAEMTKKYGAIPKGEKAARDIKVPKKISDNKYVSRTARSAIEAGITPAEFVPELQKEILDGKFTYERFPDEKAEAKAKETIEYHGFEGALEHWEFLMHSGGAISKENFSLGIALYNQCAQNGDFARAEKILADLSVEATRAGQAIQSMRLLKKMSADGTMYYLEKSIDKINDELVEKFGEKRAKKVKINEELARKYFAEKDAKKREKLYDELCKDIGEQIPSTFWEKDDAWRYLMMLFNPTTHIRNFFGNVFNKFVVMADHAVEGALQPIFVKQENRTRTWRIADKKTADFAKNDWELMKDVLTSGEGKYNNMMSDIDKNRRILRPSKNAGKVTKVVGNTLGFIPEVLRKFNSWGLEAEDAIFLGASYKSALRKIITARKLNVDNITPEQLSEIRDLAIKDALRATFREANWIAEGISRGRANLMKGNAGKKVFGVLISGAVPFTKTPMNITKQALEHSPLGVFKVVSDIVKKASGKAVSGNDIIADLARTFTGTGLAVLGFVLARMGYVSASDDEDPDKKRFDKLVGEQSYAITIGGKSYTIDWVTPASIPFLVGAQLFDATSDSGISIKTAMDSLTKIAEPVVGLSMLDGLRDILESAEYSPLDKLFATLYSTGENYFLQHFPTLGGKIHRIYDGEKKNYYFVDKNSNVPEFVQELYGSVASKLPFAVGNFQPSVDLWGRVENHGGIGERLAENLISPGYYSEENYTEVDEELLRLYESTGNGDVFPKKMYEDITIDGHKYYMNAEHYTEAAIMLGERRFDMLSRLFNDEIVLEGQDVPYSEMSDSEKATIVESVYKQAMNETKANMFDKVRENSAKYGDVPELDSEAKIRIEAENAEIFYKGDPNGTTGAQRVYWKQKYNFVDQAYKAIQGDKSSNKAGYIKDLETLSKKYDGKLSRGDKLIAENYDKVGNDDVFYTDAESYVLKKSKDGIKYEMPMSYHDYKSMTKYMDDAKEYAALYVFGNDSDKSSASKIRNQTDNMKTWIAGGLKATNSAMKGNYDLYKKGKLSADEYNAIYYDTLVGKIKTEIRAYYREIYFKKHK